MMIQTCIAFPVTDECDVVSNNVVFHMVTFWNQQIYITIPE